jgi:hypothetical protein
MTFLHGLIDERLAIEQEAIEKQDAQGQRFPKIVDIQFSTQTAHRDRERVRTSIRAKG